MAAVGVRAGEARAHARSLLLLRPLTRALSLAHRRRHRRRRHRRRDHRRRRSGRRRSGRRY